MLHVSAGEKDVPSVATYLMVPTTTVWNIKVSLSPNANDNPNHISRWSERYFISPWHILISLTFQNALTNAIDLDVS